MTWAALEAGFVGGLVAGAFAIVGTVLLLAALRRKLTRVARR